VGAAAAAAAVVGGMRGDLTQFFALSFTMNVFSKVRGAAAAAAEAAEAAGKLCIFVRLFSLILFCKKSNSIL
jgi:hypothetical protein